MLKELVFVVTLSLDWLSKQDMLVMYVFVYTQLWVVV